jgi:hypothetical protein
MHSKGTSGAVRVFNVIASSLIQELVSWTEEAAYSLRSLLPSQLPLTFYLAPLQTCELL